MIPKGTARSAVFRIQDLIVYQYHTIHCNGTGQPHISPIRNPLLIKSIITGIFFNAKSVAPYTIERLQHPIRGSLLKQVKNSCYAPQLS
jgi:hypothetical protein